MNFSPFEIYYEKESENYPLFKYLKEKYNNIPWFEIENHNNIEFFRKSSNSEFLNLKKNLIIGVRKTLKLIKNNKTSDFLVPFTSSGCTASCLYCYLVCNFNKCSYLRVFVNREDMLDKIIKHSIKNKSNFIYEIGSNSDLILENTITNNLPFVIENFALNGNGFLTFPTKFSMVDSILNLNHKGKTIIRMSINPSHIINKIEIKTSNLKSRVDAINKLKDASYPIGILIAPIILIDNYKKLYEELIIFLAQNLTHNAKKNLPIEIIFMTYSYIHRAINQDAFPNAINLYDKNIMKSRGYGKYCYKDDVKADFSIFITNLIKKYLPEAIIKYIV